MSARIIVADVCDGLAQLPDVSVQCVVTSPPYWGLRDYGVPGQIGLEPTPELYVSRMVEVFHEVWRVLRPDGVLWLNLGDCYAARRSGTIMPAETLAGGVSGKGSDGGYEHRGRIRQVPNTKNPGAPIAEYQPHRDAAAIGVKHKDLLGMPWRVAFALQAAGWWLRSDVIWEKPNAMPESVGDRPTRSHEYLFLLTRAERYYYDAEAIAEPVAEDTAARLGRAHAAYQAPGQPPQSGTAGARPNRRQLSPAGGLPASPQIEDDPAAFSRTRNRRTVWRIPTMGFPGAHFATFPTGLVEPCILAGTSERGACPSCGAPWAREVDVEYENRVGVNNNGARKGDMPPERRVMASGERADRVVTTCGWSPGCGCGQDPRPCIVLDPFAGAGTVGLVADRLGRDFVGIELNPQYATLAENRIRDDAPLFADVTVLTGADA